MSTPGAMHMTAFVTQPAPDFKADALVDGQFKQISLGRANAA